jgi:WD40 repeat protein
LNWPSLSVEWLQFRGEEEKLGYRTNRLAYGTHTSLQEPEQLIVDAVKIPNDNICPNQTETITSKNNIITSIASMAHQGEPNRIRVSIKNDFLIASKSSNGQIYIYNYELVSKNSDKGLKMILKGHQDEGYGLEWSTQNLLASGSYDKLVCYWDIQNAEPVHVFTGHNDVVEDVAWSDENTIISVGDDNKIILNDIRTYTTAGDIIGHDGAINSVDVNKLYPQLLLTGSSDKTMKIWDLRNTSDCLRVINNNQEVYCAKWAPFASNLFASSGGDCKINVWNLGKKDNPLCFTHEGHFARVNEFSWNPTEHMTIASVDDDNYMQIWCMHPAYLN